MARIKTAGKWILKGGKWVFVKAIPKTAKWLSYRELEGTGKHTRLGKSRAARIAEAFGPGLSKEEKKLLFYGRVKPGFYTGMSPAGKALRPGMTPAGKTHSSSKMVPAGTALMPDLSRLRNVDKEVYMEIKRNGDHDTASHIRSEVGALGFTGREINSALARLRSLGLITKAEKTWAGESEYMVTG